jgi:hypothetical protein
LPNAAAQPILPDEKSGSPAGSGEISAALVNPAREEVAIANAAKFALRRKRNGSHAPAGWGIALIHPNPPEHRHQLYE